MDRVQVTLKSEALELPASRLKKCFFSHLSPRVPITPGVTLIWPLFPSLLGETIIKSTSGHIAGIIFKHYNFHTILGLRGWQLRRELLLAELVFCQKICKGCESIGMEKIDYSSTLKPARVTIRVRARQIPRPLKLRIVGGSRREAFLKAVSSYNFFYYGIVIHKNPQSLLNEQFRDKASFFTNMPAV